MAAIKQSNYNSTSLAPGASGSDLGSDHLNPADAVAIEVQSNMSGSSKRMTRKERMERRMSMGNVPKSNEENRLPATGPRQQQQHKFNRQKTSV